MELRPGEMAEHGGGDRQTGFYLSLSFRLSTGLRYTVCSCFFKEFIWNVFCLINLQLDTHFSFQLIVS